MASYSHSGWYFPPLQFEARDNYMALVFQTQAAYEAALTEGW